MTIIDEAIKHAEEMAEKNEKQASWFWGKEGNPKYESCVEHAKEHRQLAEWLKELKYLREQTRWIPVSERLPEEETYVLTTIYIPGRQPHARSGCYQYGFFHNDNGDVWRATDREVIAWMPLPKPYKQQESEG